MRLAHVSDLHLLDLHGVSYKRFDNRRMFGGLNLLQRRAKEYRPEILETLDDDVIKEEVDHVAISGDLTNLALEPEYERVFHLLKLIRGSDRVSVVPGNHDYYTFRAAEARKFEKYFYPFMFQRDFSDLDVDLYPYTKQLDEITLIGLNSATRTMPLMHYGTLGQRQLDLVEKALARPGAEGRMTCLLLHHAMHRRDMLTETTAGLLGRDRLWELVDKYKVDLIMHGHDHRGRIWKRDETGHSTQVICCGSSTRLVEDPTLVARYRILTIEQGRIRRIDTKVYQPEGRRFLFE